MTEPRISATDGREVRHDMTPAEVLRALWDSGSGLMLAPTAELEAAGISDPAAYHRVPHGTARGRYGKGCRCDRCAAFTQAQPARPVSPPARQRSSVDPQARAARAREAAAIKRERQAVSALTGGVRRAVAARQAVRDPE